MKHHDSFFGYHPLVNFLYFALVLAFTMVLTHPICLLVSLAAGLAYTITLGGGEAIRSSLRWLVPLAVLAALVNVLFSHEGATILTYLPNGNPITLESIAYGLGAAARLCAVVVWFSCYSKVMTADKFVYLFGRVIPALSLVLSMTLRFVPKFRGQFRIVAESQRCMGRDMGSGSLCQRLRTAVTVFSIMVTWALENAIETADSMKSRGYGLPGRTAFSIYRFDSRDRLAMTWILFCGGVMVCAALCGGFLWQYYPVMKGAPVNGLTLCFDVIYLALCVTPVWLEWQAARKWREREGAYTS